MKINLAHVRERSTTGGWIDFVVFEAKSTNGNNEPVLADLTSRAGASRLKVDQSALAFKEAGQIKFYGDKNLVSYLSKSGVPHWTHSINT